MAGGRELRGPFFTAFSSLCTLRSFTLNDMKMR